MTETRLKRLLVVAVLLLCAVISFFFVAERASDVAAHAATISGLDAKAETVLKLSAASALASAGITAIPGDTATPIAEELADFTTYFMLILCVLYTEKYLVTVLGAAVFRVLIPAACVLFGVGMFWKPERLKAIALKLAIVGLALYIVIPLSLHISDMVDRAYAATVDATVESAESLGEKTAALTEAEDDKGLIASVLDRIKETASTLTDKAADTLNRFVETLAVTIVTSCIIPLLVLLFFLWVVKQLTGVDLSERFRKRREPRDPPRNES